MTPEPSNIGDLIASVSRISAHMESTSQRLKADDPVNALDSLAQALNETTTTASALNQLILELVEAAPGVTKWAMNP